LYSSVDTPPAPVDGAPDGILLDFAFGALVCTVVVTEVVGVAVIVADAGGEVRFPLCAVARFVTLPFERSLAVIV
jgi:hypothetical protein